MNISKSKYDKRDTTPVNIRIKEGEVVNKVWNEYRYESNPVNNEGNESSSYTLTEEELMSPPNRPNGGGENDLDSSLNAGYYDFWECVDYQQGNPPAGYGSAAEYCSHICYAGNEMGDADIREIVGDLCYGLVLTMVSYGIWKGGPYCVAQLTPITTPKVAGAVCFSIMTIIAWQGSNAPSYICE